MDRRTEGKGIYYVARGFCNDHISVHESEFLCFSHIAITQSTNIPFIAISIGKNISKNDGFLPEPERFIKPNVFSEKYPEAYTILMQFPRPHLSVLPKANR